MFRALVPGSRFVFTIEHPIYMASTRAGWIAAENGDRIWPVDHYAVEGERRTDWFTKGVIKYHRTMATTLNTLVDAGFSLRRILEWHPTPRQLENQPELTDEMERPMMPIVAAQSEDGRAGRAPIAEGTARRINLTAPDKSPRHFGSSAFKKFAIAKSNA